MRDLDLSILVGTQYGDEGKGKAVQTLSKSFDIVARWNGGPNAGHTVFVEDKKVVLHSIPTGIVKPHTRNYIGSGCVVNLDSLAEELAHLESSGINTVGRIYIADNVHIISKEHIEKDNNSYLNKNVVGTTGKGIGPCYADKVSREGTRVKDSSHPVLSNIEVVSPDWLFNQLKEGKNVLAEGAQGNFLDLDSDSYPYCTSSNCIASSALVGLRLPPIKPNIVYGVTKAYETRVGGGELSYPIEEPLQSVLRDKGKEFGATTGRPRKLGWLNLDNLKRVVELNGVNELVLTKSDVLCGMEEVKYVLNGKLQTIRGWSSLEIPEFTAFYILVKNEIKKVSDCYHILVSSGPTESDWSF